MYKDEIIYAVWKNREAYAERHQHNLHAIVCDLQIVKTPIFKS